MIVLFLSGMVAMIMMRTLHRDISNYNQLETVEEAQEETGWKLVSTASERIASCSKFRSSRERHVKAAISVNNCYLVAAIT